jgi:hypothetical protein
MRFLFPRFSFLLLTVGATVPGWLSAQTPANPGPVRLLLNDLSAFRSPTTPAPTANWRIAGEVIADLDRPDALTTRPGTGILVNTLLTPRQQGRPFDLLTGLEHGDLRLELDYMLAKGANSGVYLQGRYEVQLFDSWGLKTPSVHDNGAIYERWDETRPAGRQGYEGTPARQNAGRAPGLWQHLQIDFQAPRFDASGRKTQNARLLRVELNGVLIHENVALSGPTRGPLADTETARGPLLFQGDHGAVAFRNIRYVLFDKKAPRTDNLRYALFAGKFERESQFPATTPDAQGSLPDLTSQLNNLPRQFLLRYTGTLHIDEPGRYQFSLQTPNAGGQLRINNQPVLTTTTDRATGSIDLPTGDLPFELVYTKPVDWAFASIGLTASGPGFRPVTLTTDVTETDITDPILLDAATQPILRSFMDLPSVDSPGAAAGADESAMGGRPQRVTHGVSVGHAGSGVHYTYDLDNGSLVQVWRGQFLDATPMWHDRGDGSARPLGMVQRLSKPGLALGPMPEPTTAWPVDTTGSGYRPGGYRLDSNDLPTFFYQSHGHTVTDQLRPMANGQGLDRSIGLDRPAPGLAFRIATGTRIEPVAGGLYRVDERYYVRPGPGVVVSVRSVGGRQELLAPVATGTLNYTILF